MIDRFVVAVDVVCFALDESRLKVLVVQRREPPFAGMWALPGGIVRGDESLDEAAERVLSDRTRLAIKYLEQLYTFGEPARDPRSRAIAVAYYALLPTLPSEATSGENVDAISWQPVDELPSLAFDHARTIHYALRRIQQKLWYTPIVFRLLPETFTFGDIRRVFEVLEGKQYPHLSNFQTQVRAHWALEPVPGAFDVGSEARLVAVDRLGEGRRVGAGRRH